MKFKSWMNEGLTVSDMRTMFKRMEKPGLNSFLVSLQEGIQRTSGKTIPTSELEEVIEGFVEYRW